MVEVAQQFTEV